MIDKWLDRIPGLMSETPAEKARREGTLVYDEEAEEWIELPHE